MDNEHIPSLWSASNGDTSLEPLKWWRCNERHFPTIPSLARHVLVVQYLSVASELQLLLAVNLIGDHCSFLGDDTSSVPMCVRSFKLLLGWGATDSVSNRIKSTSTNLKTFRRQSQTTTGS